MVAAVATSLQSHDQVSNAWQLPCVYVIATLAVSFCQAKTMGRWQEVPKSNHVTFFLMTTQDLPNDYHRNATTAIVIQCGHKALCDAVLVAIGKQGLLA